MGVQQLAAEQRIEDLESMEDKRLESKMQQEVELRQEAEIRQPEVETTEEGEGSGTGASNEEEVRYEENKEVGHEGMIKSRKEINRHNEDADRDDDVSDGEKYVEWYAV